MSKITTATDRYLALGYSLGQAIACAVAECDHTPVESAEPYERQFD